MLFLAGLVLDPQALLALPSVSEASALLYLAALVTAAGFVLWYSAVHRLGVERGALRRAYARRGPRERHGDRRLGVTPLRVVGALVVGIGVTVDGEQAQPSDPPARLHSHVEAKRQVNLVPRRRREGGSSLHISRPTPPAGHDRKEDP
jgi:hypothetical protein